MRQTLLKIYFYLLLFAAVIICADRFSFSYVGFIAYGLFILLILIFIIITGRIKPAISISSSLIIIIQLLNQIKVHYYKERLFFSDFDVALDLNNFGTLFIYPSLLFVLAGLLLFLLINIIFFIKAPTIDKKWRFTAIFISAFLMAALVIVSQKQHNIEDWQAALPKGKGTITNLFISGQNMHYSAPYYSQSSDYFKQQANPPVLLTHSPSKKPDIIVLLQESTVDPRLYDLKSRPLPALPMFEPSNWTKIYAPLRVQTFGGGTWLSEFSLLTGLNSDDFLFRKNSVFYTVAPHIQNSLLKEMKRNGYYTVVLSPMQKQNYNAGFAYEHFGIDLILQPQDLGYPADKLTNLWTIPSEAMLNYAQQILNRQTNESSLISAKDKPLFLFVLTMAEHGPYDNSFPDKLGVSDEINNSESTAMFNSYFNRLQLLSSATDEFSQQLLSKKDPAIFVYFGDHQPNAGWKGGYNSRFNRPDYLTQFYLRDNLSSPIPQTQFPIMDISFLGGLILERAGLSISPFYEANIKMMNLCQGGLEDCPDQKMVNSYKHYIYQELKTAGQNSQSDLTEP